MLLIVLHLSSSRLLWRTLSYSPCVVFYIVLYCFVVFLSLLSLAPCKAGVDRSNPFQGGWMTTCHAVDEALRHRLQLLCGDEIHHVNATNRPKFSAMISQSFVIFQQSWNNTKQLTLITLSTVTTRHIFRNATVVAHHKLPQSCFTWPTLADYVSSRLGVKLFLIHLVLCTCTACIICIHFRRQTSPSFQ